jgi:putative hydrolase of the HAD superfamily
MTRVLLLDALGTLVALEPPAPILRRELAARFGLDVSEPQAAAAIGAEMRYYRAHLDHGRDQSSLAALRRDCAEVLRAALPPSQELVDVERDQLIDALLTSLRFSAFPDAPPAIADARERGWRVVVASNWDVSLHQVLDRLGLAPLLDGVVTSAEIGARKPSPVVFERALALVRAQPGDAVHVGDSVEEDVRGARAAGIEPILLSREPRVEPPAGVTTIASLSELAGTRALISRER